MQSVSLARTAPADPDWADLAAAYATPEWFRDAKFGIWAHWGPQCIPEYGDWYGRLMYLPGTAAYDHHVKTYGHPSATGFMDLLRDWKIDQWDPDSLMARYKRAGARYFVAMAGHHDNFDMWDSRHHAWNVARVGPKRDTMAGWAQAARAQGLRFGVSNHLSHAWHWWQTAYGYDPTGAKQGLRYDAFRRRAAEHAHAWWAGLDPQELYTGPAPGLYPPDGIGTVEAMAAFHDQHSGQWLETPPPAPSAFARKWLLRSNHLVDSYRPDLVYYDNYRMPLGPFGMQATLHYYKRSREWHGEHQVVATSKLLETEMQRRAITEDVERGYSDQMRERPWQTCTCIGNWHYDRPLYERRGYVPAKSVVQRLADVVAKNGNLLLSVPVRANGSLDDQEIAILDAIGEWMAINGEALLESRPWRIFGEGPWAPPAQGSQESSSPRFTHRDIRYTARNGALYALAQDWPADGPLLLTALATASPHRQGRIERVDLLGHEGPLAFRQAGDGLAITLPDSRPAMTPVLRISGPGLT